MSLEMIRNDLHQTLEQTSAWINETIVTPVVTTWNNREIILQDIHSKVSTFCEQHQVAEKVKRVGLTALKSLPWVALAVFTPWYVSLGVSIIAIGTSIAATLILRQRLRQEPAAGQENMNAFLRNNMDTAGLVPIFHEASDGISIGMLVNGSVQTIAGLVTKNFFSAIWGITTLASATGSLARSPRLHAAFQGIPFDPFAFLREPAV
jgi:hypothetical protein